MIWQAQFNIFGKVRQETNRLELNGYTQNLRYQGQYFDVETGLHYNLHRYYDPDIGRFTTQDPIGLAGGMNLYQYAPNALGWVDPLGLSCSFDSRVNRWRNNQTGRFTTRPTDPSELIHNGQIKYTDIKQWASQGGISNQWNNTSQFASGGFKYQVSSTTHTYTIHGHGVNPNAVVRYPTSNSAQGPTASITTRPLGGSYSSQTNTLSNGIRASSGQLNSIQKNLSHIPLNGSPY